MEQITNSSRESLMNDSNEVLVKDIAYRYAKKTYFIFGIPSILFVTYNTVDWFLDFFFDVTVPGLLLTIWLIFTFGFLFWLPLVGTMYIVLKNFLFYQKLYTVLFLSVVIFLGLLVLVGLLAGPIGGGSAIAAGSSWVLWVSPFYAVGALPVLLFSFYKAKKEFELKTKGIVSNQV